MICNGSISILENRNCHEGLRTKLASRSNESRCTSETSFHNRYKNESIKSNQTNTLQTLGVRALENRRNAALKMLPILNLGKPVSHAT